MKKVFDINYLIKEAEENFTKKPSTKIKTIEESDSFIKEFIIFFETTTTTEYPHDKKISIKQQEEILSEREIYTLKKSVLDHLTKNLFKTVNDDFFANYQIIKLTKNSSFTLASEFLNKNEIAYIYLNIIPQSTIKFTKNSQIVDPVDGSLYEMQYYYQGIEKKYYPAEIAELKIYAELNLFLGVIILKKLT
jgi:hypothetical protein